MSWTNGVLPKCRSIFINIELLAKADPDHPAFGVSNQPHELSFWRDSLDVIGLDPYPLMNMKAGRPLTFVGQWTRAAREATFHSRPVWMVLQFFQGWSTDRWPTEEELRTMSLMAITEVPAGCSIGATAPERRCGSRIRSSRRSTGGGW